MTLFIADQIPTKNEIQYWTNFLNQDTAVFLGIEKIAKKSNFAVVFLNMNKIRRGSYEVEFNLITDEPDNTPEYYITDRHVRLLEQQIIKNPQYWMWSHRRWKHKRNL
ncbi:MAG: hypothetical protein HY738_04155 [Bacteroidia bacterium]|nr:hypothetical protein [Bacteroidia bacterium]